VILLLVNTPPLSSTTYLLHIYFDDIHCLVSLLGHMLRKHYNRQISKSVNSWLCVADPKFPACIFESLLQLLPILVRGTIIGKWQYMQVNTNTATTAAESRFLKCWCYLPNIPPTYHLQRAICVVVYNEKIGRIISCLL
jgi:hypothetical protein